MTSEERAAIEAVTDRPLRFRTVDGRQELQARPCPLLDGNDCTVYAVRPYQCRRYGCYREDLTQPADFTQAVPVHVLADRSLRRQYARTQSDAQVWALAHGWRDEMR